MLVVATTATPGFVDVPTARWSCWGAAGALALWALIVAGISTRRQRTLQLEISLRPQHYVQACAHLTIYTYWSYYWQGVHDAAPLIAAQLAFAYGFDLLLSWTRRETCTLGFGPFPIIFSTNLFLWFKPEWFYLQFVMVAVGFAAREFLRWEKHGRMVHIFNPSSFPLSLCSLVLILTGSTNLTWGQEIATTQLFPPHMYLVIFLVSLPGQVLFGVSRMTVSAVVTTYLLMALHHVVTGMYVFEGPTIPIAVFLGMHLLFTDPSTSPASEAGRILFGALYGASVVALYIVLDRLGVPTFYDKLLPVPVLNLAVQVIDRFTQSDWLRRLDPSAVARHLSPRARNVAYTAVWALVFAISQQWTATATTLARADGLLTVGRLDDAIGQYQELVARDPSHFDGQNKLGYALLRAGRSQEALAAIQRALTLAPNNAEAHNNFGLVLMQTGQAERAVAELRTAATLNPAYAEAHYNLGHALLGRGQPADAVAAFRDALKARPDWSAALSSLAWVQATEPAGLRNPDEALQLASRAAELTHRQDAQVLDVLAAAYAAGGRFAEATQTAEAALALASRSPGPLARDISDRLQVYRSGQPIVATH